MGRLHHGSLSLPRGAKPRATSPPLPASAVEYWHSERGITLDSAGLVDQWAGQVTGLQMGAPASSNRCVYGVDGTNFGLRNVIMPNQAAVRYLSTPLVTGNLFPAGSKPYLFVLMRVRAYSPAGVPIACCVLDSTGGQSLPGLALISANRIQVRMNAASVFVTPTVPNGAACYEEYIDGSGALTYVRDSQIVTTGTGLTTGQDARAVSIGADTSIAFVCVCSSVPTDAERYALRVWAYTEFGIELTPQRLFSTHLALDLNSDVVTLGTGTRVASWSDQGAYANTPIQGTLGNQPTQVLADMDARAAINFVTANNQKLVLATGVTGIAAGDKPWVLAIANFSAATTAALIELTDVVGYNRVINLAARPQMFSTIIMGSGATSETPVDVPNVTINTPQLFESGINASDQAELRVQTVTKQVSGSVSGGLTRAPTRLTIGCLGDGNSWPMGGKMYRVLVVNPTPSSAQRVLLLNYLRSHYPSVAIP